MYIASLDLLMTHMSMFGNNALLGVTVWIRKQKKKNKIKKQKTKSKDQRHPLMANLDISAMFGFSDSKFSCSFITKSRKG